MCSAYTDSGTSWVSCLVTAAATLPVALDRNLFPSSDPHAVGSAVLLTVRPQRGRHLPLPTAALSSFCLEFVVASEVVSAGSAVSFLHHPLHCYHTSLPRIWVMAFPCPKAKGSRWDEPREAQNPEAHIQTTRARATDRHGL